MKFLKEILPYIIIFLVVVIIRTFIATPVVVSGSSMDHTLSDGQILLLKKYDKQYERFDIIVFDYQGEKLVKRIIGLPGETVEYLNGKLYINDIEVEDEFSSITNNFNLGYLDLDIIPEGYYFVLGDNRPKSSDSRLIGLINQEDIEGSTNFSIWPFKKIK